MGSVIVRSLGITAIAVTLTFLLSFAIRGWAGAPIDTVVIVSDALIPIVITFPLSLFVFHQGEQLRRAHEELKLAHSVLTCRASHDGLTGLLNRESFLAQIDLTRFDERRGVLLIVDADHFKRINDTCGHEAGDEALRRISTAITSALPLSGATGRLGGEEFGILLRGASLAQARSLAEAVRLAVQATAFAPAGCEPVPLSVSIGGAHCVTGAETADILRAADRCLYDAKRQGRNRVVFASGLSPAGSVAA
ncbi:diguanylate cyclase (GGDEF) domain-containing protein [Devosia enhydra]|uniref:diguanylate cyclase n=1 Tax=Devosia enhydra TaxID=665118 RepID=A0A1K2HUB3_9HYPH|nr:GGDEF domain-containing protein [Devosia enhydra]SFZ81985.1 diguanylate cyclase (GGDEF) domain-containing protein [Devosia enhydra]